MTPMDQVSTSKLCPFAVLNNTSGANIVRCSTDGLLPFAGTLDKRGKAKVANLEVHVRIKENVAQLWIT